MKYVFTLLFLLKAVFGLSQSKDVLQSIIKKNIHFENYLSIIDSLEIESYAKNKSFKVKKISKLANTGAYSVDFYDYKNSKSIHKNFNCIQRTSYSFENYLSKFKINYNVTNGDYKTFLINELDLKEIQQFASSKGAMVLSRKLISAPATYYVTYFSYISNKEISGTYTCKIRNNYSFEFFKKNTLKNRILKEYNRINGEKKEELRFLKQDNRSKSNDSLENLRLRSNVFFGFNDIDYILKKILNLLSEPHVFDFRYEFNRDKYFFDNPSKIQGIEKIGNYKLYYKDLKLFEFDISCTYKYSNEGLGEFSYYFDNHPINSIHESWFELPPNDWILTKLKNSNNQLIKSNINSILTKKIYSYTQQVLVPSNIKEIYDKNLEAAIIPKAENWLKELVKNVFGEYNSNYVYSYTNIKLTGIGDKSNSRYGKIVLFYISTLFGEIELPLYFKNNRFLINQDLDYNFKFRDESMIVELSKPPSEDIIGKFRPKIMDDLSTKVYYFFNEKSSFNWKEYSRRNSKRSRRLYRLINSEGLNLNENNDLYPLSKSYIESLTNDLFDLEKNRHRIITFHERISGRLERKWYKLESKFPSILFDIKNFINNNSTQKQYLLIPDREFKVDVMEFNKSFFVQVSIDGWNFESMDNGFERWLFNFSSKGKLISLNSYFGPSVNSAEIKLSNPLQTKINNKLILEKLNPNLNLNNLVDLGYKKEDFISINKTYE